MKILGIEQNSIAEELGIVVGAELIAFDGFPVTDILDVEFYSSRENFVMTVCEKGETVEYEIEKDSDENLGLILESEISVRSCVNNCIFCFVSQLPKAERLRSTLKVKDDDYRHSFISGNYITLTNVSVRDLDRIIRLKLSPLYISVHTTNAELRAKMLGAKNPPNILTQMQKLKSAGIVMHTQVVYCPGYNEDLDRTVADLKPLCESLAVVPVGLTKNCNKKLRPVSQQDAAKIVQTVEQWQNKILPERGTRFVFAADEFYVKANAKIPPLESYENLCQIENGVGLLSSFLRDFEIAAAEFAGKVGEISVATGKSAYPFMADCAQKIMQKFGGTVHVYAVENEFFGHSVTVAGLVVGRDIISQLSGKPLGEKLMLPRTMLREFHNVFLDNTTVPEVEKALGVRVQIVQPDGESFVKAALGIKEKT